MNKINKIFSDLFNINRSITDEFDEFTEELYTKHFERKNGINKYYGQ